MSELVDINTQDSVFLTLEKYNDTEESEQAELFLQKQNDILTADQTSRGYICFERLRCSMQGSGASSMYFTKCDSSEYVIVRETYSDQFRSTDLDDAQNTTTQTWELLHKFSHPANVRLLYIPPAPAIVGQVQKNSGWLPDIKAEFLTKTSELCNKGYFRWMNKTVPADPQYQPVFPSPLAPIMKLAVLKGPSEETAILPLYQLIDISDPTTDFLNLPQEDCEGLSVRIAKGNMAKAHTNKIYTIKSFIQENHGRIVSKDLIDSDGYLTNAVKFVVDLVGCAAELELVRSIASW